MRALVETINQTLRKLGAGPGRVLIETIDTFEGLQLTDQERLSALASSIAHSALAYHATRVESYLDAIRTSAMAIALEILPPPPSVEAFPTLGHIAEGADLLTAGLSDLLEALFVEAIGMEDRVITEVALYARLLGRHDPNAIETVLRGIDDALQQPDFSEGDLVSIPLGEPMRIDLTMPLKDMPILGIA